MSNLSEENTPNQPPLTWDMLKTQLRNRENFPFFKEGEVWWCNIGDNIGIEINGKGNLFLRPVLIFKKHSRLGFLGIPLTTAGNTTNSGWYVDFQFQGKTSRAALAQIRILSVERLFKRMGTIDDTDMEKIRTGFNELYE